MGNSIIGFRMMLLHLSQFAMLLMAFSQPLTLQRRVPSEQPLPVNKVSLGCISRGGKTCRADGYGCLVMFPQQQWSSMRKSISKQTLALEGEASVLGESPSLYYEFKALPSIKVSVIPIDNDIPLDSSIAKSLGFKSIIILKGKYQVDSQIGKLGGVVFKVDVRK
jgi:hypothetical protein